MAQQKSKWKRLILNVMFEMQLVSNFDDYVFVWRKKKLESKNHLMVTKVHIAHAIPCDWT